MAAQQVSEDDITLKLYKWSTVHAAFILTATIITLVSANLIPLLLVGSISFLMLIFISRNFWRQDSKFGAANISTSLRLSTILIVVYFHQYIDNIWLGIISVLILIGDGIDGWLARRSAQSTEFGEYFDKETDAYFMHILIIVAVFKAILWEGIIILGLLRYLFALFIFFYETDIMKERRSQWGKTVYVLIMISLILPFFNFPYYSLLVFLMGIILFYSFGKDILWIFSNKSSTE